MSTTDQPLGSPPSESCTELLSDRDAQRIAEDSQAVIDEITTVVEGKEDVARLAVLVLLADGHLLIEDVPGVGKTMLAKSLAAALGARNHRIQFTPDLLPGDVTGASVYNQSTGDFEFRPGAVFTEILLADEINRASPKTQSALLEAMEERQVTADSRTYPLPEPFMVVATANPVEMDGTYRLPEAQRDRFLARTTMGYPAASAEARMLAAQTGPVREGDRDPVDAVRARSSPQRIAEHIRAIRRLHVAPPTLEYTVNLARATREADVVALGASPRATVHLLRAAKTRAAMRGQTFVSPTDIQAVLAPVWTHRLHLTPQALSRGVDARDVLDHVLRTVPVS